MGEFEDNEAAAMAAMSDTSDWHKGSCPQCQQPVEWRHTGLRMVVQTGDENAAGKEFRTPRPEAPDGVRPTFEHNKCEGCQFIGRFLLCDVYLCSSNSMVIARYGDTGSEYASLSSQWLLHHVLAGGNVPTAGAEMAMVLALARLGLRAHVHPV